MKTVYTLLTILLFALPLAAQQGAPEITFYQDPACQGDTARLHVRLMDVIPTACGPASSMLHDSVHTATSGTGTGSNGNTLYPAPYGNWYKNARHRFIYRASELNAIGFYGGKITSLAWNVLDLNSSTVHYKNFQIKLTCTADSVIGTTFDDSLSWTVVMPPQDHFVTLGWNTHEFLNYFDWDGVSNLYVEICFDNLADVNYTENCSTEWTTMTYNSSIFLRNDVTPLCQGAPTTFFVTQTPERPNTRFTWRGSDFDLNRFSVSYSPSANLLNTNSFDPLLLPGGSPSITVTVTDNQSGLSSNETITVNYSTTPFNPVLSSTDTLFCPNEAPVTLTCNPSGGNWTGTGISSAGIFSPQVSGAGVHTLTYTIGAGTQCFGSTSIQVEVGPPQNASITSPNPLQVCSTDQPVQLTALTPGGTWIGAGVDSTGVFNPLSTNPGLRPIIYYFDNYCLVADTIQVNSLIGPNFSINSVPQYCNGQPPFTLTLNNAGGPLSNLYWGGNAITDTNLGIFDPSLGVLGPNMVTLTASSLNGCTTTDTLYVTMYQPNLTMTATDTNITQGQSVTMIIYGASSWLWSTGQTVVSITVFPDTTTTYWGIGTLPNGCSDTMYMTINVAPNIGFGEFDRGTFSISLQPNPAQESSVLKILSNKAGAFRVEIINAIGQVVSELNEETERTIVFGDMLPSGQYWIRVTDESGKSSVRKFIKQ